jgi:hypothetical protein
MVSIPRRSTRFEFSVNSGAAGELLTFARDELLRRMSDARERIWLASPFLTAEIAERVSRAGESSSAQDKRLLTALVPGSVQVGVLDPNALRLLCEKGFEVASIANLHAKVSLIDSSWGLIGSGNLTNAGLGSADHNNVELGVVLSPTQIDDAASIFDQWWEEAKPVPENVIDRFAALPRIARGDTGVADFGPVLEISQTSELEQVLNEDKATANARQNWIKSNYHRRDEETWWRRGWISDRRWAPYEIGDLIVLYLSKRDGGPGICPVIVRVDSPPRYDRDWVIEKRDMTAADRWPYVTKTSVVAEIPISAGISLSVANKTGQSVQGGYCSISLEQFEQVASAMSEIGV